MKWLKRLLLALVVLFGGAAIFAWSQNEPRPSGESGPAADDLARKVQGAVGLEGWKATKVVRFNYAGRHHILWDRGRGYARVNVDDWSVLLRTRDFSGRAYRDGVEVTDASQKQQLLTEAEKWFVNDGYWLFPFEGLFDPGVTRAVVSRPGQPDGLLISYSTGGVTPGDAYLWELDQDGRPVAWKMWVSVLPIGGLRATWEAWERLPTGAQIATEHRLGLRFRVQELSSGDSVVDVEPGPDPFLSLSE